MPVLIEKDLTPTLPLNHARIGYEDVEGEYSATSSASDSPAVAAKSWQTFERWRPTSSPATLTKEFDSSARIDYIGIGASTLSRAYSFTVELLLDGSWREIELTKGLGDHPTLSLEFANQEFGIWEPVPDNEAVMILLRPRNGVGGVRITVEYDDEAPSVGKLAAGEVLTMHRPFYQGHSPAVLAADVTRTPSVSQGGEWLGNTIIRQGRSTQMSWQNLPAPWVRRNISGKRGLIEHAVRLPFFVAWNPLQFRDCLYAQSEGEPQKPNNAGPRDLQSWQLDVKAYSDGSEPVTTPVVFKDYDEIVTHTRASEGTYWDETRTLRIAEEDEPRFTHDPATGEALGLLVEGEAVNEVEDFFGLADFDLTNVSLSESSEEFALGENWTRVTSDSDAESTRLRFIRNYSGSDFDSVAKVICKAGSAGAVGINYNGSMLLIVNLETGEVNFNRDLNQGGSIDLRGFKVTPVHGGYRLEVAVRRAPEDSNAQFRIHPLSDSNYDSSTGTPPAGSFAEGDSLLISGAEFLPDTLALGGSPIITTGTPATRAADVVSVGEVEKAISSGEGTIILSAAENRNLFSEPVGATVLQVGPDGAGVADEGTLSVFASSSVTGRLIFRYGSESSINITEPSDSVESYFIVLVFDASEATLYLIQNGELVRQETIGAASTLNPEVLYLNSGPTGSGTVESTLRAVSAVPYKLSQSEIEALDL